MAGLIAAFAADGEPGPLDALVLAFPTHAVHRESWRDERCAVVRLHHGVIGRGPQPVWNADHTLALWLDGEVLPEADGGAVAAGEDAAARCLSLLERRDHAAFARLNGSFALIAYDRQRRRLSLISDRLNTRPLYFFVAGSTMVVASYVAALAAHPACPKTLNRRTLHQVLVYERVVDDATIYHGVERLEPASVLTFDGRTVTSTAYWRLCWQTRFAAPAEAAELMADRLREAVRRRLAGRARPGLLLSGGLDSRAILAVSDAPPRCFTQAVAYNREVRIAEEAARRRGSAFYFVHVEPDQYAGFFDEAVRLTNGIQRAQAAHFLPALRTISRYCNVLLSGYGFDGMYRGLYLPSGSIGIGKLRAPLPRLMRIDPADLVPTLVRTLRGLPSRSAIAHLLTQKACSEQPGQLEQAVREGLCGFHPDAGGSPYNAWDYLELRSIAHLRAYGNVMCVRAYMDDRVVAFDRDLLDVALALPPEWRLPDTAYRAALRRLMPPALARLSDANTGIAAQWAPWVAALAGNARRGLRAVRLWPGARARDTFATQGSWPNFAQLLRRLPQMRDPLRRLPESEALGACQLFDGDGLREIVDDHLNSSRNHSNLLLTLLMIDSWIRQFGADGAE